MRFMAPDHVKRSGAFFGPVRTFLGPLMKCRGTKNLSHQLNRTPSVTFEQRGEFICSVFGDRPRFATLAAKFRTAREDVEGKLQTETGGAWPIGQAPFFVWVKSPLPCCRGGPVSAPYPSSLD